MPSHPRNPKQSKLRIIGGQWRGRKLSFEEASGLRPTSDRIRETLFNWLAPNITGAQCLDLFAGTGALGLECLSRGAAQVWLLEKNTHVAAILDNNLKLLDAGRARLIKADAIQWLRTKAREIISAKSINIAFIDPPFGDNLWKTAITALEAADILAIDARIYIETPLGQVVQVSPQWELLREKSAGNVCYRLYRRK